MPAVIPEICDFDCPFADFAPADTAGICRTMSAVWCRKLRELVNKNAPCTWRQRQQTRPAKTRSATTRRPTKRPAQKRTRRT
jgi:hypothetical protein